MFATSVRGFAARSARARRGLVVVVATTALVVGLVGPAAAAPGGTKTITDSATIETATPQAMFGPGNASPLDATWNAFEESFDTGSGSFEAMDSVNFDFNYLDPAGLVCYPVSDPDYCKVSARFGISAEGSISGTFGMAASVSGTDGGTVDITYPVTVTFTAPADNSFDPGDWVDVETALEFHHESASMDTTFPVLDQVKLDATAAFASNLSGEFCFVACTGNIDFFDFDEAASGELFRFNPMLDNFACADMAVSFIFGFGPNPNANKCGGGAFIFSPDVGAPSATGSPWSMQAHPDGRITAGGSDEWLNLPVSIITWLSRASGLLPVYVQLNVKELAPFGDDGVKIGWTSFQALITYLEVMKQSLEFTPRVDLTVEWPVALDFQVVDGDDASVLQTGAAATSATFTVGDTLRLKTPALKSRVLPMSPALGMGSALLANSTSSESSGGLVASALAIAFQLPSWEVCTSDIGLGFLDDIDLGGCLGWNGVSVDEGPLWEDELPFGTSDKSIFDGSFQVGGFTTPALAPFDLVPRPQVELRKEVVPPNAPGTFDVAIDGTTILDDAADGAASDPVVLDPGTRTITEADGTGGDTDFFDVSITCVHRDGGALHSVVEGATSLDLALTGGEDLICTVLNRLPVPAECDAMTFDAVILGTPDSDVRDVLEGTPGNDIIVGYGGDDQLVGDDGHDCIAGNDGDDTMPLGDGDDVADGGAGDDKISAGPGHDILYGGAGRDDITGAAGSDWADGGPDRDVVNGGSGDDTCIAERRKNCEA